MDMNTRWLLTFVILTLTGPLTALAGDLPIASASRTQTDNHDVEGGLVGWWQFEKVADGAVLDSSGKGHDASAPEGSRSNTLLAEGRIGKALLLDGTVSLRVVGFKGITGTGPRTVSTWIRTKSSSGKIVSWGANEPGQIWNLGYIRRRIGVSPKGGYLYMNEPTDDGEWHHIAIVVNEASPPNLHDDVTLYKDGEPAAIHDIGLLDLWPINTGKESDVTIGSGFEGLMDDLRIYGRALSEEEIRALFQQANKE